MLSKLKTIKQPVKIIGHENSDVDSFISSILFLEICKQINIPAEIVVTDKTIDQETYKIVKKLGFNMNDYKGVLNDTDKLFLLDHYKTPFKGTVVGCIDHHPTTESFDYPIYINKRSSSCSYMLFEIMEHLGLEIPREIIELVAYSMFIDTCSLRSSKVVKSEAETIKDLIHTHGLDFDNIEKVGLCLTDLDGSIKDLCFNGSKNYTYNAACVRSSYLQTLGDPDRIDEMVSFIVEEVKNSDLKLWVFLIMDFKSNQTTEYRIWDNNVDKFIYDGILSRGTNIMPKIEALF